MGQGKSWRLISENFFFCGGVGVKKVRNALDYEHSLFSSLVRRASEKELEREINW